MPQQLLEKEKDQARRPVLPRRLAVPTVSYQVVEGVSEEEIQQRLDRAFDVLFREFFRDQIAN